MRKWPVKLRGLTVSSALSLSIVAVVAAAKATDNAQVQIEANLVWGRLKFLIGRNFNSFRSLWTQKGINLVQEILTVMASKIEIIN